MIPATCTIYNVVCPQATTAMKSKRGIGAVYFQNSANDMKLTYLVPQSRLSLKSMPVHGETLQVWPLLALFGSHYSTSSSHI